MLNFLLASQCLLSSLLCSPIFLGGWRPVFPRLLCHLVPFINESQWVILRRQKRKKSHVCSDNSGRQKGCGRSLPICSFTRNFLIHFIHFSSAGCWDYWWKFFAIIVLSDFLSYKSVFHSLLFQSFQQFC